MTRYYSPAKYLQLIEKNTKIDSILFNRVMNQLSGLTLQSSLEIKNKKKYTLSKYSEDILAVAYMTAVHQLEKENNTNVKTDEKSMQQVKEVKENNKDDVNKAKKFVKCRVKENKPVVDNVISNSKTPDTIDKVETPDIKTSVA